MTNIIKINNAGRNSIADFLASSYRGWHRLGTHDRDNLVDQYLEQAEENAKTSLGAVIEIPGVASFDSHPQSFRVPPRGIDEPPLLAKPSQFDLNMKYLRDSKS